MDCVSTGQGGWWCRRFWAVADVASGKAFLQPAKTSGL